MNRARALSLHHLVALDATPIELVAIAGRLGCAHVTLFTHVPEAAKGFYPCVTAADVPALQDALAAANVTVGNIEVFSLDQDEDPKRFAEALAVGASIGATRATAHLHDIADGDVAIRRFAEFCEAASAYGITPGLEFNGFSAVRDIVAAGDIVRAVGCGAMVLDVLHLMRNGADVGAVSQYADLIAIAQISDGPLSMPQDQAWHEAVRERALPGHGEFPLAQILAQLGDHIIIEAEVPQNAERKAGVSPFERASRVVSALRSVLNE